MNLPKSLYDENSWKKLVGVPSSSIHGFNIVILHVVHVFSGELAVPLNQLQLLEGQDMDLVSLEEIRRGWIWSKRLQAKRPLAPVLHQLIPKLHELDQAA